MCIYVAESICGITILTRSELAKNVSFKFLSPLAVCLSLLWLMFEVIYFFYYLR